MTPAELKAYWVTRQKEIEASRTAQSGKGKGKTDPSPWVAYTDFQEVLTSLFFVLGALTVKEDLLGEAMAQLAGVELEHVTEIDRLKDEHARALQKVVRGM